MRLGFFFGAGAEVGYGLPSGGQFAIDLFRQDVSLHKQALRNQLQTQIDRQSIYATNWLPDRFDSKRIHAFGKNEFSSLIESSIEYRKQEMIRRLNQFDVEADIALMQLGITPERLAQCFREKTGNDYGTRTYTQVVRMNPLLAQGIQIFASHFYSAVLDVIRISPESVDLQRYAASFIQLLVGAQGQDLVQQLNQELFTEAPDDISFFDDISGMFKLEFTSAGSTAMDLLLAERRTFSSGEHATISDLLSAVVQQILENIFSTVLDYQSLIDSHFRYLYSPKTEWAKFTKMAIFLRTTREYISSRLQQVGPLADCGYYHDLQRCDVLGIEISAIGTANYNSLVESIANEIGFNIPEVMHLNGGVNDYYNPYKNSVLTCNDPNQIPNDQIYVPFILTQSGLKPLTSVDMSRRYVTLFDSFAESDGIVVIGYGFNVDDTHINGMFRELVEDKGKHLYWVCASSDQSAVQKERELVIKLRISSNIEHVHVILVNRDSRLNDQVPWIDVIHTHCLGVM